MALIRFCLIFSLAYLHLDCALIKNELADRAVACYLKNKTNFEKCLFDFWYEVGPLLVKGLPEYNIPQTDPLYIDIVDFKEKSTLVNVDAKFTNITVIGASKLVPKAITVNPKARQITVNITFPFLNCTGDYDVKGTVTLLPVDGSGKFTLNMTGINAFVVMHLVQKGTGVGATKLVINFDITHLDINVKGILGGDAVGEAINKMIQENSLDVLEDVKPAIIKQLETKFYEVIKNAFVDMPPQALIA